MAFLYEGQQEAVNQMKNGCILCGGVGSGKSRTSLSYYYIQQGGVIKDKPRMLKKKDIQDLVIITTARKRDTGEWEPEMLPFLLTTSEEHKVYNHHVYVDSWNNISKYTGLVGAFFIFDEQRLVGSGTWVKAFLTIAKKNNWVLLSATPGDCWLDYIPVFVANGFYRNASEFKREHVIYKRWSKFPAVDRYLETRKLERLRDSLLVNIEYQHDVVKNNIDIWCMYDRVAYKNLIKTRWNPSKDQPIMNASELCYEMRKIVNSSPDREVAVLDIVEEVGKAIIFYNFDYERELLMNLPYMSKGHACKISEWTGHAHQPIPDGDYWVYLVQYTAGAEGWNCIKTNNIIFYSLNYSYKIMEQSKGRIDRLNTPYHELNYYILKSRSGIDLAIAKALKEKKKFNEGKFIGGTKNGTRS